MKTRADGACEHAGVSIEDSSELSYTIDPFASLPLPQVEDNL